MPAHDTNARASARLPHQAGFHLASDTLCIVGGAGLATGVWLLPHSSAGGVILAIGAALGIVGLAFACIIGIRAARAHTPLIVNEPDVEYQAIQQAPGPKISGE